MAQTLRSGATACNQSDCWVTVGSAEYIASVVAEVTAADRTSTGDDTNARLIDAASGWHQADAGTILSSHSYDAASVRPSVSTWLALLLHYHLHRHHLVLRCNVRFPIARLQGHKMPLLLPPAVVTMR